MKPITKHLTLTMALTASLVLTTISGFASVNLTTFDNVDTNNLGTPYGTWSSQAYTFFTAGPTSYDVNATVGGFGGRYFPLASTINASGTSNIVLTVNWTNSFPAPDISGDGIVLVIGDVHTNELIYQWYNLPTGRYVLTKPLYPADIVGKGSGTLDLSNLSYVHLQGDSPVGASYAYSIQWQNLDLAGAMASVEILTFDNYHPDDRYGAWADASSPTIVTGPTNWTITATGGGSDWVYLGGPHGVCYGAGQSNVVMTVTISGLANGDIINPYVELLDEDGTDYTYTWYSLTNGQYVLTMPAQSPTTINVAGTTPGLDLARLQHSHIGVDTGGLPIPYTISFEDLSLSGAVVPTTIQITSESYDPQTHAFTLTWTSASGKNYTVLSTSDLTVPMSPVATNIPSGGTTTTTTVTMPAGDAGFVRIQEQ